MNKYSIREYIPADESDLFALIEREGDEWIGYWGPEGRPKYRKVLADSLVYVIFEGEVICGYARCRDDDGFGVYVYDLLVDRQYRGREYGRLMMEQVCRDFPNTEIYVMGDAYPYYEDKLGYKVEEKIYAVKIKNPS